MGSWYSLSGTVGIYINGQLVFTFKDSGYLYTWAAGIYFQRQWVFMYMGAGIFVKFCVNL